MASDCVTRLLGADVKKALFGNRDVPEPLLKRFVDDLSKIKQMVDEGKVEGTYEGRAAKYIKEQRELSKIEENIKTMNSAKALNRFKFYTQPAFLKDPLEGLKAMYSFSKTLANGGQNTVKGRVDALRWDYANSIWGQLKEKGLEKMFVSGALDKEVRLGVEALWKGKNADISPEALEIAKTVKTLNEKFIRDMRAAGLPVRELEGFITTQMHSRERVEAAGFEAWSEKIFPLLDHEKTFGVEAGNINAQEEILKASYESIRGGGGSVDSQIGGPEIEDTIMRTGYTMSLADKTTQSRSLHFKDALAAHTYNEQFGRGTLAETLARDAERKAKIVALTTFMGTNPEGSMKADMDRLVTHFERTGDKTRADIVKRARADGTIENIYKEVTGATSIPGVSTLSNISRNARLMVSLADLAFTGVRSLSNFAIQAMEIRNTTGQNFLEAHLTALQEWLKAIPKENRQAYAKGASFYLGDTNRELLAQGFNEGKPGLGAKAMQRMMEWNGLSLGNDASRIGYGNTFMWDIANNSDKKFKDLVPGRQASLLTAGIEAPDYEIIKHAQETAVDGRVMTTADQIPKLEITDEIKARAKELKMSSENYLREMQLRYSGYMALTGDVVTTTPGTREMAIIKRGTLEDTMEGELRRLGFLFKSYAVQAHFIGLRTLNARPDLAALERGVLQSSGQKDFGGLAMLVTSMTAIGYVAQALIDTANGKGVQDPRKAQTWVDAMGKGGAGGLYMDYLTGQHDKYSFAEQLAGPVIGQIAGPAAKIVAEARNAAINGKSSKQLLNDTTRLVRSNIPFQQVPGAKQALDYLQRNVIMESLNPGYLTRSKAFRRRDDKDRLHVLPDNVSRSLRGEF